MPKRDYITLMCSLPHLGHWLASDITPLSRLQLERRLDMLCGEHRLLLRELEALVHWNHMQPAASDAAFFAASHAFVRKTQGSELADIVTWRIDLRTITVALRARKNGAGPPSDPKHWSRSPHARQIARHWDKPYLGMERVYPWVNSLVDTYQEQKPSSVERRLLQITWDYLTSFQDRHEFDFLAVAIYVLRWHVIDRWVRYHGERGAAIFEQLVTAQLQQVTHNEARA